MEPPTYIYLYFHTLTTEVQLKLETRCSLVDDYPKILVIPVNVVAQKRYSASDSCRRLSICIERTNILVMVAV